MGGTGRRQLTGFCRLEFGARLLSKPRGESIYLFGLNGNTIRAQKPKQHNNMPLNSLGAFYSGRDVPAKILPIASQQLNPSTGMVKPWILQPTKSLDQQSPKQKPATNYTVNGRLWNKNGYTYRPQTWDARPLNRVSIGFQTLSRELLFKFC